MTNTPKLSLQEGLRVRKAVLKAIADAASKKLPCPVAPEIGDAVTALWIANQTVDYLNEGDITSPPPVAPLHKMDVFGPDPGSGYLPEGTTVGTSELFVAFSIGFNMEHLLTPEQADRLVILLQYASMKCKSNQSKHDKTTA